MTNYEETVNAKALDDGYGDTKYDGKGEPGLVPSFVTNFKPKPVSNFEADKKLKYLACEVDGQRYTIGDYAMKLDPNISWMGRENKHADSRFPILLKTTLGLMTSGTNEVIDLLMMNLPIKYDTASRRMDLISLAQGTHEVKISTDGVNFVDKVVTVDAVMVKKQPFGSLCDLILDERGEIINPEMARGFNVIVDVGARTLNILTVDALEEQDELSTQTNDGMFTAYNYVGSYLESQFNAIIPDGKLPHIIQTRQIQNRDITPIIDRAYEMQANNILTILDKVLINSQAFVDNIIFTGGGADKELLQPYFYQALGRDKNCIFLDRYSTVKGLRKYGIRTAKRNIKRSVHSVNYTGGGHND